ncbi:MAB_1171c family putative transporter [Streptomyces sp. HK10]|uniref:MAB_1171c family putative transporter n=1 Tax=Streptomyces sp. HK10 TaxID=3373255 RepID=UPI003747A1E3
MLAFFAYAVAATMTAVAVWRLPAVLYGDTHRRALWGCYAGFAAALWLKTPAIKHALNHSPITDLSILIKHYVSTAAILAILTYVVASYGRSDQDEIPRHVAVARWIERVAYKASIASMVLMTVLFFTVVDRSRPSTDFVAEHAGQWGATAYMSVFYLYLGAASAVCGYQWTSAARRAETRLLRTGLILMSIAMALGVTYVVSRVTFMWVAIAVPLSTETELTFGSATEGLQIALFFLFAAGASIPTTSAAASRWRAWRSLWRLYPLWRDLMKAVPGISFTPPTSRLREIARATPPVGVRLDRWVQDIADAVDQLRHYAPPLLLDVAEAEVADQEDAPAAAEAHWINAVLVGVASSERYAEASEALPPKPIADPEAEAAWLERVQAARAALTPDDGRVLLDAAKEPAL